jgi:phospholipid-binding lipoprotein MlaA
MTTLSNRQTPSALRCGAGLWLFTILVALLAGCSTAPAADSRDPFESVNRRIFAFNEQADRAVLAPVARSYRSVTPVPLQRGISNLFANLGDLGGTINAGLQGRPGSAARNGSRFILNSTLGVFGLFDVASRLGIERYQTDFGHTLAVWGVDQGPYVMLPLLGPRTARSGVGTGVDFIFRQTVQGGEIVLPATETIETRARLLDAEALISGDRYLFIREAYFQRRAALAGEPARGADFLDEETSYDWGE